VKIKVDKSKRAKQRGIYDSDVWNIELSLTGFVDEVSLLASSLKIDSSAPDLRSHRESVSTPKLRQAAIPAMSLPSRLRS
jgi:inner membrane protein involved in colicin E2 resistance